MKKEAVILMLVFLLFINSCDNKGISQAPPQEDAYECSTEPIPGLIHIKIKEQSFNDYKTLKLSPNFNNIEKDTELFKPKNQALANKIGLDRWRELKYDSNTDLEKEVARLKTLDFIEEAELVYPACLTQVFPNDPRFSLQWHLHNTGDNIIYPILADSDIDAPEAWEIERGSEDIMIGNPDTGIFWSQPDLVENLHQNLGEDANGNGQVIILSGNDLNYSSVYNGEPFTNLCPEYIFDPGDVNGVDDDNNGYVDDFIGWDFYDNDNDPWGAEDIDSFKGHGTSTTGLFGAKSNDSFNLAGICWNCSYITTRAHTLDVNAIVYLVDNGARVISMSWKLALFTSEYRNAFEYAHNSGVVLAIGAGNSKSPYANPLCYTEQVICTGGTSTNDSIASWSATEGSDYGKLVDVAAPATLFTTVHLYHVLYPSAWLKGTSLSTPIVAGVAGLMLSKNPNLSPDEVTSIIQSSTDPILNTDVYLGTGRVNAYNALNLTNRTLITGSYPVAIIDALNSDVEVAYTTLIGKASSPDFERYEIWYGQGYYPTEWMLLRQSDTPVSEGTLAEIPSYTMPPREGILKLVVIDSNNQVAYDTFPIYNAGINPFVTQQINLSKGWNLFSLKVSNDSYNLTHLNSNLILKYDNGWVMDEYNQNPFPLETLQGYYVYSETEQEINFTGLPLEDTQKAKLQNNTWTLFTVTNTTNFTTLYPNELNPNLFLTNLSGSYPITTTTDLSKDEFYWVSLNLSPQLSPPTPF